MYNTMKIIFWATLALYIFTLLTVSYVGVYLTYIALPVLVISGLLMKLRKPKKTPSKAMKIIADVMIGLETASGSLVKLTEELDNVVTEKLEEAHRERDRRRQ